MPMYCNVKRAARRVADSRRNRETEVSLRVFFALVKRNI